MDTVQAAKTRPGWVWFICAWYTFAFVTAAVMLYLLLSKSLSIVPQYQSHLENVSTFDYVVSFMQALLVESAAIALFMLRRQATYLFWLSFGAGLATNVYHLFLNDQINAPYVWSASTRTILFIGTQLAICVYCENLKKRGTLT